MSSCEEIIEILPEYINNNTTKKQNAEIAHHISLCVSCRADFALWLTVERTMRQTETSAIDYQALFAKLPDKETELSKIINSGSYNMAFDLIRHALSTVKTTYRLASLVLGG